MRKKNIIDEFKEQEDLMNMMANSLGFSLEIIVRSSKTATLKLFKKRRKIITFETLDIEVKSQIQLIVKKGETIITDILYYKYLLPFISHYLYYQNVEFVYQFIGGKYNKLIVPEQKLEKMTDISIKDFRKQNHFSLKDVLEKQPTITTYRKAFFTSLDYETLFFVYDALDI